MVRGREGGGLIFDILGKRRSSVREKRVHSDINSDTVDLVVEKGLGSSKWDEKMSGVMCLYVSALY